MKGVNINVFNIVGNHFCIDTDDGQKIYNLIKRALENGKKIKLSFQNIDIMTSAFLNVAIGQIYRDFKEETIREKLSVENISNEDIILMKRVIKTAKIFYKDPDRLKKSIDEILGEN